MEILVLSDHETHKHHDSIYPILVQLSKSHSNIYIASISLKENLPLSNDHINKLKISISRVDHNFSYSNYIINKGYKEITGKFWLNHFDFIILRIDPPVNLFLFKFLEKYFPPTRIINNPIGILKTASKDYLHTLSEYCPPMKTCISLEDIDSFIKIIGEVVLKPMISFGGKGIIRINEHHVSTGSEVYERNKYLSQSKIQFPCLAMKFMTKFKEGDKRTLVFKNKIIGSFIRYPHEGSWICNISQGGRSAPAYLDPDEEQMIINISKKLSKEGILLFGVDTLMDDNSKRYVSEINVTNVGGFIAAKKHSGTDSIKTLTEEILKYFNQFKKS